MSCVLIHCDNICVQGHSRVLLLGELSMSKALKRHEPLRQEVEPVGLALLNLVRVPWAIVSLGRPLLSPTLPGNIKELFVSALCLGLCRFQDFWNELRAERDGKRELLCVPHQVRYRCHSHPAGTPLEGLSQPLKL